MKIFLALAAAFVLAQGAGAATNTTSTGMKPVAKSNAKKKKKKKKHTKASVSSVSAQRTSVSAATESASLSSLSMPNNPDAPAASALATSTAKASTTVTPLVKRFGMDTWNHIETGMKATNNGADTLHATDNNVGINYKLTDTSKVYLRQQYTFDVPNTGASATGEMHAKTADMYLRYQNSEFFKVMNDGSIGGRVTVSLPTGEDSRRDMTKMHNGKISVRGTLAKPINKWFNIAALVQVGYNNMANEGVVVAAPADPSAADPNHPVGTIKGTTFASLVTDVDFNFEPGLGLTITQSVGTAGSWTHATQDYGIEQSNNIELATAISRDFGPLNVAIGVAQESNIMPDAPAESRWTPAKFMDDASSIYYLELATSI